MSGVDTMLLEMMKDGAYFYKHDFGRNKRSRKHMKLSPDGVCLKWKAVGATEVVPTEAPGASSARGGVFRSSSFSRTTSSECRAKEHTCRVQSQRPRGRGSEVAQPASAGEPRALDLTGRATTCSARLAALCALLLQPGSAAQLVLRSQLPAAEPSAAAAAEQPRCSNGRSSSSAARALLAPSADAAC